MKKLTALLALLLAGVLGLAACSNGDTSSSSGDTSTAQFNDADVEFAQGMIPHHQQAVEMSQMAETHADDPEVKTLASDIEAAQGPEIDTMTQWLEDWDKDVPSDASDDGMGGMDMGDGSHMDTGDMPGMMSDDDLHELDQARGTTWDRMFLTLMIRHHEGAIEMARTEQAHGENADAVALARKIEDAQTAEIATMKDLLTS
jgi:uncharacterized protein (DUF305 family)